MAVKRFIESAQPEYFFCGHIHEAEGRQIKIGNTTAITWQARPSTGAVGQAFCLSVTVSSLLK